MLKRKSSYSGQNGHCVEVSPVSGAIAITDSKRPTAPPVTIDRRAFGSLLAAIKADRFSIGAAEGGD